MPSTLWLTSNSYGNGKSDTESLYRRIDVFDISNGATDVKGTFADTASGSIASSDGVLAGGIEPAAYCSFLDFNVNGQLERFGVHNGGDEDDSLLNEKWESIALAPVEPGASATSGEVFVFSFSDNDFVTQDGAMDFGNFLYKDSSGYDFGNQALVFQATLPKLD